jgi:hypothetical protein
MVAKRPAFGQLGWVYLMISAARGHTEPALPVCSGALLLVCARMVADQASISSIDLRAYAALPVRYQASASVYAAMASSRSSVQPLFGLEYEPHSTVARGFGGLFPVGHPGLDDVELPAADQHAGIREDGRGDLGGEPDAEGGCDGDDKVVATAPS